jgi:hypothetical protein
MRVFATAAALAVMLLGLPAVAQDARKPSPYDLGRRYRLLQINAWNHGMMG